MFFLNQGCLSFSLKHLLSLVLTPLPKDLTYLLMKMSRAERIRGGDNNHWEGSLRLPALAASGLAGHCSIIDVQYRLDLHVDPSGPSFDLVVSFPLLLGTIPLQEAIPGLTSSNDTQFGGGFTLPPPPDQFK